MPQGEVILSDGLVAEDFFALHPHMLFAFYLFRCLIRDLTDVLRDVKVVSFLHEAPMEEGSSQRVLLWLCQEETHSETELDIAHRVWVLPVEQLINLVNGDYVGHMPHLVVESCQVDIQLVVVVVPKQLEHAFIDPVLLHYGPHHVGVDELVDLLDGHVHPVVGRNVPFQLKEVSPHIVDVDEAELFVDVVLRNVDVEVIVAVLVEAGLLGARSHIRCHRVADD